MNALKFSESGTTTTLITTLSQEKDWVRISVRDEGMGLNMVDTDSLSPVSIRGDMKKEEAASDYPMRRVSSHTIKEEWALRMQRERGHLLF